MNNCNSSVSVLAVEIKKKKIANPAVGYVLHLYDCVNLLCVYTRRGLLPFVCSVLMPEVCETCSLALEMQRSVLTSAHRDSLED